MKASQALALFDNQEFITPEHVQELVVPVLAHRLVLDAQVTFAGQTGRTVVEDILKQVPVPG
jgi:MoxR-like ATPase